MTRAPDTLIIAERSWPVGSADQIPQYEPVRTAAMPIAEAARQYKAGFIEIATGRTSRFGAGRWYVVESLYAIPRRVRREPMRQPVGRGNAAAGAAS
jgi:hypothetical protein